MGICAVCRGSAGALVLGSPTRALNELVRAERERVIELLAALTASSDLVQQQRCRIPCCMLLDEHTPCVYLYCCLAGHGGMPRSGGGDRETCPDQVSSWTAGTNKDWLHCFQLSRACCNINSVCRGLLRTSFCLEPSWQGARSFILHTCMCEAGKRMLQ